MKNFMFITLALVLMCGTIAAASTIVSVGESTNMVGEKSGGTSYSDAASGDGSKYASLDTGFSRCVVDADCDASDVCILGDCYTPLECRTDKECGGNNVCYRGICISPICIVSAECPPDFICTETGTCQPKECVGDSFCGPGMKCVNYECVKAPSPMALEQEPAPVQPAPATTSLAGKDTCPVCDCSCNCQPCESATCPKLECPACGPMDGQLEIPILLFGLVVVAAIGFFAGKMGGNSGDSPSPERSSDSSSNSGGGEKMDINDEGSFRYI